MGKSTISMAIFNSKLLVYQRGPKTPQVPFAQGAQRIFEIVNRGRFPVREGRLGRHGGVATPNWCLSNEGVGILKLYNGWTSRPTSLYIYIIYIIICILYIYTYWFDQHPSICSIWKGGSPSDRDLRLERFSAQRFRVWRTAGLGGDGPMDFTWISGWCFGIVFFHIPWRIHGAGILMLTWLGFLLMGSMAHHIYHTWILWVSGMSSSQLTNSYFSEG